MNSIPHNLYTAAQVRELDRLAMERFEISGTVLMERAGAAAFAMLTENWPQAKQVAVLCGTGNNGGDGYVIARLAHEAGLSVTVFQSGDVNRVSGDALAAMQRLQGADVTPVPFTAEDLSTFDVLVDALLGTGLSGDVKDEYKVVIGAMNKSKTPVLAVDIPSGIHADTGGVLGAAVYAERTITFIGMKQGLLTHQGPDHCGQLIFNDLQVPAELYDHCASAATRLDYADFKHLLPPRLRATHKGQCGHVLIVGGDSGFSGAVRMAGEAAARTGAGLVSVATRAEHAAMLNVTRPELMCHGIETEADFQRLAQSVSVIAIGPGLGQSEWAHTMLAYALASDHPLVMDADALNLLAQEPMQRANWVLTPHPGEAARLLNIPIAQVQKDRFAAIEALTEKFGGVTLLKGTGSLVKLKNNPVGLCSGGNPGMASGGMGDVLTGIIAGLLAQGLELEAATKLGVCLHAEAGDAAANAVGERGMLASDLMPWVRRLVNPANSL